MHLSDDGDNSESIKALSESDDSEWQDTKSIMSNTSSPSDTSKEDENWSEDHLPQPPRPITPVAPSASKRTYQQRISNTPPVSPSKKKIRIQGTIRMALDQSHNTEPSGILRFFKQSSSKEEYNKQVERTREEVHNKREEDRWTDEKRIQCSVLRKKQGVTERKRKSRFKLHEKEILLGMRSPGGTKRNVRGKSSSSPIDF